MAKTDYQNVDEYIASFPEPVQNVLTLIRQTIREEVPDAVEVISYQIPAFKYHGWLFYFSAFKDHFSLSHPPPLNIVEVFRSELSRYPTSRSTIRFPLSEPVPVDLIRRLARFRANENVQRNA